jgi:hypothetical protein
VVHLASHLLGQLSSRAAALHALHNMQHVDIVVWAKGTVAAAVDLLATVCDAQLQWGEQQRGQQQC